MILVDANVLVYSANRASPHHERARKWLDAQLSGHVKVGFPWVSLTAFLRVSTNPRIFPYAMTMRAAWEQVTDWLAPDLAWIPGPTDRHAAIFERLIASTNVTANLVTDAHLAAIAIEHGLTLCSTDGDFARFRGLRWENPLA